MEYASSYLRDDFSGSNSELVVSLVKRLVDGGANAKYLGEWDRNYIISPQLTQLFIDRFDKVSAREPVDFFSRSWPSGDPLIFLFYADDYYKNPKCNKHQVVELTKKAINNGDVDKNRVIIGHLECCLKVYKEHNYFGVDTPEIIKCLEERIEKLKLEKGEGNTPNKPKSSVWQMRVEGIEQPIEVTSAEWVR